MKIFPEYFEQNPLLRLFGGAFIFLGIVSLLLASLAVLERTTTSQTKQTTTLAFTLPGAGQTDSEVQKIEPASGQTEEKILIVK